MMMLRTQLQTLFDSLSETEYRSAFYFSQRLGVSVKTIRNYMKELSAALRSNGADVESKPRYGYRLVIKKPEQFSSFIRESRKDLPKTSTERNLYLLNFLLSNEGYIKIDDLSSLLYISRSSISGSIHMVEKIFSQYDIYLDRKPGYGLRAIGDEFDKRRLLCYTQLRHKLLTGMDSDFSWLENDLLWTARTILQLLDKYDIHLTEVAFDNFTNYVYVGLQRLIGRQEVHFKTRCFPVSGIKEKAFVSELAHLFSKQYGVSYSEDEKQYILLYLSGKQLAGYTVKSDENFVISEEIDSLSMKILKFIDQEFHSDLASSFDLRVALNQHLVPLEVRMKYGLPLTNPLADHTKTTYPLAYSMAVHAKTVLCDHYQKNLSDAEIAYLALIFALQLKKESEMAPNRINVLIVSSANVSALNLLKYQYENQLSSIINEVYFCDVIGLKQFDFSLVDYILTTVPITIEVSRPIFEIDLLFDSDETKTIEEALWQAQAMGLRSCYTPRRFVSGLKGRTSEEILHELCDLVELQEEVSPDFRNQVFAREEGLQVHYGTGIAMVHPRKISSDYTFAYIAVLDRPILWNGEAVVMVMLASPGGNDTALRQNFYESAARLVLDEEAVSALSENPAFNTLVELLQI